MSATMQTSALRRLAAALVLLSIGAMLAGCSSELYSDLKESEANEIVTALAANGIDATKERLDGSLWEVSVADSEASAALDLLRSLGLPRERFANIGEMFQKQGLVSTPTEERMRYIHAVSQELAQTLGTIDGVVTARVHVVIPTNDPLSERTEPSSAAVFIKHRPDVDLRLLGPAVKDLVAHSIEGVTADQVSLSLFEARGATIHRGAASASADSLPVNLSQSAAISLIALLVAAAISLMALPSLLRKRGLNWRTWLQTQVLRR